MAPNYNDLRGQMMASIMQAIQDQGWQGVLAPGSGVSVRPPVPEFMRGLPAAAQPTTALDAPAANVFGETPQQAAAGQAPMVPVQAQAVQAQAEGAPRMDAIDLAKRAYRRREKKRALQGMEGQGRLVVDRKPRPVQPQAQAAPSALTVNPFGQQKRRRGGGGGGGGNPWASLTKPRGGGGGGKRGGFHGWHGGGGGKRRGGNGGFGNPFGGEF